MTTMLIVLGVIGFVVLLVGGWFVAAYNRLVRLRNQVDAAWAQIDVQLKRRHSLIPNLVETVRGYATHERTTLDAVISARNSAASAGGGPSARIEAEGELSQALGRLFALTEAYPDLKASHNFTALQRELAATEDKIAYARQFYNNAIQTYNGSVQSFPTSLVAAVGSFASRPYFEAAGGERADVDVRF